MSIISCPGLEPDVLGWSVVVSLSTRQTLLFWGKYVQGVTILPLNLIWSFSCLIKQTFFQKRKFTYKTSFRKCIYFLQRLLNKCGVTRKYDNLFYKTIHCHWTCSSFYVLGFIIFQSLLLNAMFTCAPPCGNILCTILFYNSG